MTKELELEIHQLNLLRDQQVNSLRLREDEIGKLLLDKCLLEEEKASISSQLEAITQKSLESLSF